MKKTIILVSFIAVAAFAGFINAAPRDGVNVDKVYKNDGDTITPIYISCSSTTWTTVLSASPTRRVAKLITLASTDVVCLSTNTTTASICDATRPGYRLQAQLLFEHASEAIVKCRAADTKAAVAVYGLDYTDSKDSGDTTN